MKPEYINNNSPNETLNLSLMSCKIPNFFAAEDFDDESFVHDFSNIYLDSKKENFLKEEEKQATIISNKPKQDYDGMILPSLENLKNYLIKDETEISDLLDRVQADIKVPKTSINKLKTAFKKKGWTIVKIIRIQKKKKMNNWDFLQEEFKDVCPQITGIALYLEDILEQVIN